MKKILLILLFLAAAAFTGYLWSTVRFEDPNISNPAEGESSMAADENTENLSGRYTAALETTAGTITIELDADKTPKTVANFVKLANDGFYDNTIFHRVMEGFMIQGGDPNGDGTGGPGYTFDDEPFEGEYTRGAVAMANRGPNTNGSQFFIMHQDYDLPKEYVIFGRVIEGIETVDAIATAPVTASPTGENSVPIEPVAITSISILQE